jgi:nucleoid DNA-binding protein
LAITRSALVKRLASTADVSERDAAAALSAVLDAVAQALCRSDRVELRGFGAFTAHQHQARAAHNPRTGDPVRVPAKKSVHFKPGRELLRALNGDDQALAALRAKQDALRRRRDERNGQLSLF